MNSTVYRGESSGFYQWAGAGIHSLMPGANENPFALATDALAKTFKYSPPGMMHEMMVKQPVEHFVYETSTVAYNVWNSPNYSMAKKLRTIIAFPVANFVGARGISDFWYTHDAVDGHVQSRTEQWVDGVSGTVQVGLTLLGANSGVVNVQKSMARAATRQRVMGAIAESRSIRVSLQKSGKDGISNFGKHMANEARAIRRAELAAKFGRPVDLHAGINARGATALSTPQGLSSRQFDRISSLIRSKADKMGLGSDIVVQGSRANGTAVATSDIDFAIKVSRRRFNEIINDPKLSRLSNPTGSLRDTRLHAIRTGKIHSGRARLSSLRKLIENDLGMKVDLSIIRRGGRFDNGLQSPLSFNF